jgi:hypothetical protein
MIKLPFDLPLLSEPLYTTVAIFSAPENLFNFFRRKCAKCLGGHNEGLHRVRGANAVRMGTVTFTVTPSDLQ